MKKTQKGVTLVEVIVAIAVFSIISLTLFSSIIAMKNVINRQEEYVKLEMVCYDIDAYWEKYENTWFAEYFGINEYNPEMSVGYLDENFKPISSEQDASFLVESKESTSDPNILIISIFSVDRQTAYVNELQCQKGGN